MSTRPSAVPGSIVIKVQTVSLGRGGPSVSRIGLGMAALGRPAYITTGRAADFGEDRSEGAFRRRSWEVLDAAYAAGIRYLDCARSYGSAEAFVAGWLARIRPDDVVVGSKWGYTYVGGWDPAAAVHEVKDHSLTTFERQHAESRALLGTHLRLYQVHSATLDSGVLENRVLHETLARQRDLGLGLGITTSGPFQADTIRRALEIRAFGVLLEDVENDLVLAHRAEILHAELLGHVIQLAHLHRLQLGDVEGGDNLVAMRAAAFFRPGFLHFGLFGQFDRRGRRLQGSGAGRFDGGGNFRGRAAIGQFRRFHGGSFHRRFRCRFRFGLSG